ncbi:MAG: hypothetical protein A2Y38_13130 [Spirochaetes bacterium GWB1_59_5]|nr:MAG: hypothetical protein A2Y38_13130 [Spirochaetes bacterium GWB1_59_5]
MSHTYNWAVLGCGKIAGKFAADLKTLANARLYAAASRSIDTARAFAVQAGFQKAYGSYEELVSDPEVDIVYVATPHSHHRDHTLLCLKRRKAVLCEKAFAINSREVAEMIAAARTNDTFLMEAFWTRFQPSFQKVLDIVSSGELGTLKLVRADFAFKGVYDPDKRLYNVALGGGSLLDIGIYPVFAALMTLGKPDTIKTLASFCATGAEESIVMSFGYPGGRMASLASSIAADSPTQAEFWFEGGYARLNRQFNNASSLTLGKAKAEETTISFGRGRGSGYELEAAHVMDCLDSGKKESPLLPLSFSADLMEVLDRVRKDAGIVFPDHDET